MSFYMNQGRIGIITCHPPLVKAWCSIAILVISSIFSRTRVRQLHFPFPDGERLALLNRKIGVNFV